MSQKINETGDNSLNAQAARDVNIYVIQTPAQVDEKLWELFKINFPKMLDVAQELATERVGWFNGQFATKDPSQQETIIKSLADPDKVNSLFEAQKNFALSGNEDLGAALIDLLNNRCLEPSGTLKSIVLREALKTAPLLTIDQMDIITCAWVVTDLRNDLSFNFDIFCGWLRKNLIPFTKKLPKTEPVYIHIEYTGAVLLNLFGSSSIAEIYLIEYPHLFSKGFDLSEIDPEFQNYKDILFRPSFYDSTKFEFNLLPGMSMETLAANVGLTPRAEALKDIQNRFQMNRGEVDQALSNRIPEFVEFQQLWDSTLIKNLHVNAVGVAIAYTRWRQVTDAKEPLELFLRLEG